MDAVCRQDPWVRSAPEPCAAAARASPSLTHPAARPPPPRRLGKWRCCLCHRLSISRVREVCAQRKQSCRPGEVPPCASPSPTTRHLRDGDLSPLSCFKGGAIFARPGARVRIKAHTNTFQDNAAQTPVLGPHVYCAQCGDCPPTKNYIGAPIQCPGAGSELYRGLGSVVVGGLTLSALLTLAIIPPLLSLAFSIFERDPANHGSGAAVSPRGAHTRFRWCRRRSSRHLAPCDLSHQAPQQCATPPAARRPRRRRPRPRCRPLRMKGVL